MACGGGSAINRRSNGFRTPGTGSDGQTTPAASVPAEALGRPGGKIVLAAPGTPTGYDLVAQSSVETSGFLSLACNGLMTFENGSARIPDPAGLTIVPDLASASPEQPDGNTYIFRLRAGIKWQPVEPLNARAFTAADVKWQYDRAAGDPRSTLKTAFGVVESVESPDDRTVTVKLKEPYAPFLPLVAGGANRFIQARELADSGRLKSQLIGTGPFSLELPVQNGRPVFRKNPLYFKRDAAGTPLPYADEVNWLPLPDTAARLQALQSGQAGISSALSPDDSSQLKSSNPNDFEFQDAPGVSNYIYMRLDRHPFDDKRVRQAMSLALDRPAMVKALGGGSGQPDLPIPVMLGELSLPIAKLGDAARFYQRDIRAAKQLMAAAGLAEGIATAIAYSPVYGAGFVLAAQLVRGYLSEIGIHATLVSLDYVRYLNTAFKGDFEGLAYGVRGVFPDSEPYLGYYYLPDGIYYQDHSNDQHLQSLVKGQRQELDRNKRIGILNEVQRYLSDTQLRVYDVAITRSFAWQKSLKNYRGSVWPSYSQLEAAWLDK
jgi:peptide/nickel transport system substrate-binding protein